MQTCPRGQAVPRGFAAKAPSCDEGDQKAKKPKPPGEILPHRKPQRGTESLSMNVTWNYEALLTKRPIVPGPWYERVQSEWFPPTTLGQATGGKQNSA